MTKEELFKEYAEKFIKNRANKTGYSYYARTVNPLTEYAQDIISKINKPFYNCYEEWFVNSNSVFHSWAKKLEDKGYNPSYASALIERAFYLYVPKETILRGLTNKHIQQKGEYFYVENKGVVEFVGKYTDTREFLNNQN